MRGVMMKKAGRIIACFAAIVALLLSGCAGEGVAASGSGTLTVGVRSDIMRWGYLNPVTGKYYGLEIDLAKELASDLGYADVEFVTVTPDDRKEKLQSGEVDCLIAAYSIEETRLENFDFSPAYYSDYSCVMVEKSTGIETLEDLVGKTVGVMDGANTAPEMSDKMIGMGLFTAEDTKGTSLYYADSYEALSEALQDGTVDAAGMDGCIARAYMNDDRQILEETISEESYGVATQKDSELSDKVAEAIQTMLDDGTIDALVSKWV